MWPVPPEQPRYAYEATLRNAASAADDSPATRLRQSLTGEGEAASFGKPAAVAVSRGRVYVGDTEGRRIFVFDLARRRSFAFGTRREGELRKPAGIAIDANGLVHVVDASARRLVVYDAIGLFQRAIDGTAEWVRPTGVAVSADGARLHVVDTGGVESDAHRVLSYDAQGRLLRSDRPARRGGRRVQPAGGRGARTRRPAVGAGRRQLPPAGLRRAGPLRARLRFAGQWPGPVRPAARPGDRPRGLIYVSDASFGNVQVFQADGQLLLALGSRAAQDGPGRFSLPSGVACDETGRVYVVDQFFHKVEVLRRLGDAEGQQRLREAHAAA